MDIMNPIAGTLALRQTQTMDAIGAAVFNMAMDTVEAEGEAITESLESVVNPAIGGNIDVQV